MPTTNDLDNVLEQLGKSTDPNYETLVKKQEEVVKLLKRETEKKNKNIHIIRQLQDYLSDVNEQLAKQNQFFKDFHDEFQQRVGDGKDFDAEMLADLAKFQNAHVEAV